MIIKENTEYRTRDGQKKGPLTWDGIGRWQDALGGCWYRSGGWWSAEWAHPYDLVAEWSDAPQPDAEPDHTIGELLEMAHDRAAATTQPDADGWIPWEGGECPVAWGAQVEARLRNGEILNDAATQLSWLDEGSGWDIIAYRLVTPAKDPAQIDTDQLARLGAHVAEKVEPVDPPKSLRDEFAMHALAGIMSQSHAGPKDWTKMGHGWGEDALNSLNKHESYVAITIAGFAYQLADAMMAARRSNALRAGEVGE